MEPDTNSITPELRSQLAQFVADRLTAGDPLISLAHFHKAMVEGYQSLVGRAPSQDTHDDIERVAREMLADNPQAFAVPGVENWVIRSLLGMIRKRGWNISQVQEHASGELRGLLRQEQVRAVLANVGLTPQEINQKNCLRAVSNTLVGKEDPQKKRAAARLAQISAQKKAASAGEDGGLDRLLAEPASEPNEQEINQREDEQSKGLAAQRAQQMQVLIKNLDAHIERGHISAEDAERLRKLHQVDVGVRSGKIGREKAGKIRNSILSGQARDRLEKKIREEVDYVAIYAQVFEALQRIDPRYDPALSFLIRHKESVNALEGGEIVWREMLDELIGEYDTMHQILEMMDRRDAEVRMIAVRLPPYSYIVRRGQDRVEKLLVEENFIAELRELSKAQVMVRLNAPEREERVRLAAAMLSVIGLVTSVFKPTPFRKQMRMLRINLIVDEFFRSTEDVDEAREKAQIFLRSRLEKIYPDITEEETAEIQGRSEEIIAASEKKVTAEREAARKAKGEKEKTESASVDSRLTPEEREMGVLFGRVVIHTGGGDRMVPYKIMPDPDKEGQFVLAKHDKELNRLVPMMRGGKKRYVEKNKQGIWEVSMG